MKASKGYYCLIQYCPDRTRLKAATIGVLLFCPERDFLKAMTARGNARIKRFFGREGHDWKRIRSLKSAIEERLEVEAPEIRTHEDLERFVQLRANEILISPPRSMSVDDPENDLKQLFAEVVGGAHHRKQPSVRKQVEERFRQAGLQRKLHTNVEVTVPVFDRQITVPFGYQNGRYNLIQPFSFQSSGRTYLESTASRFAVEGRSLYEHPDRRHGDLKLVVVAQMDAERSQEIRIVRKLFQESHVDLCVMDELDKLIQDIRETGKDIAAQVCQ